MPGVLCSKFFRFYLISAVMAVACFQIAFAQDTDRRPLVFTSLSGSHNDTGQLFKLDTAAGYRFNSHFEITAGLPVYFVRASDDARVDGYDSKAGIGNFYVDFRVMVEYSDFYFSSSLRGSAPTGDEEEGFSSGRMTLDWNNYMEYGLGKWVPFGSAGIANSISDTHFFTRPFTTLGIVGQFEGGLLFNPLPQISLGGSGYAVVPEGQQTIYSRLVSYSVSQSGSMPATDTDSVRRRRRAIEEVYYTVADADIAKDHGFSGWVDYYPLPYAALEFGYSRSVSLDYDSLFFSVRFDLGEMIWKEGY
jgi:hypothetical protein